MVNLTGHEAGNGGYRQGTPTTRRAFLYSDNKLDKGGHFAAWEQPQLFSEEVRASFRSLRSNVAKSDVPFAKAS